MTSHHQRKKINWPAKSICFSSNFKFRKIREIIRTIAKNDTTILLASHLLDEVEKICSHVIVIRNGKKLYAGRVDTMTASNGLIEVMSDGDTDELIRVLKNHEDVAKITQDDKFIIAHLESETNASIINKYLIENNIPVSHLIMRKPSLEEQFLDLTNNQQLP